jgi:hypothetical protein
MGGSDAHSEDCHMTAYDAEEYRALRATIRERGTTRIWVFVGGLVGWAGLLIATAALAALPVATLLPLLVLTGVFEAVFSLHTGVERIGRYLQVYFEEAGEGDDGAETRPATRAPRWERVAMAYGRAFPGGGDPLFTLVFIGAAILNFVPVLIAEPVPIEVAVIGFAHLLFILRLALARRQAGRQRALDLERFQKLKADRPLG